MANSRLQYVSFVPLFPPEFRRVRRNDQLILILNVFTAPTEPVCPHFFETSDSNDSALIR
jgi:hypothetical protein